MVVSANFTGIPTRFRARAAIFIKPGQNSLSCR
jgi:hypothetical protein